MRLSLTCLHTAKSLIKFVNCLAHRFPHHNLAFFCRFTSAACPCGFGFNGRFLTGSPSTPAASPATKRTSASRTAAISGDSSSNIERSAASSAWCCISSMASSSTRLAPGTEAAPAEIAAAAAIASPTVAKFITFLPCPTSGPHRRDRGVVLSMGKMVITITHILRNDCPVWFVFYYPNGHQ